MRKAWSQFNDLINYYKNSYWLSYIRGTEGILIGLAEELGKK
jgi:hypothetical protein